jgi:integrase
MAGISDRVRTDGTTYQVRWRTGGTRHGQQQYESFTNRTRAEQFRVMVEEAGEHWPQGWTKGVGFAPPPEASTSNLRPTVEQLLVRYVAQLTAIEPAQRQRYLRQAKRLDAMLGSKATAAEVTDEDVRRWIVADKRAPKTIANWHGFLSAGMEWAVGKRLVEANPCKGSKLPRTDVGTDEDGDDVHWLTPEQYEILLSCLAVDVRAMVEVAVGTGLRFGELTALMPMDVDLTKRTLRVRRAWKKEGDDGERPQSLKMLAKHEVNRGHYLGPPKTKKSRRTVTLPESVCDVLREVMRGKAKDDLIFCTPARKPGSTSVRWAGGRAWNQVDFYESRWKPAIDKAMDAGLDRRPRFHDLRHTFAVWLISARTPLPVIQQKLGHESIKTTSDRYGGFLPETSTEADAAIDAVLTRRRLHAVSG